MEITSKNEDSYAKATLLPSITIIRFSNNSGFSANNFFSFSYSSWSVFLAVVVDVDGVVSGDVVVAVGIAKDVNLSFEKFVCCVTPKRFNLSVGLISFLA